jgi:hypothetical protein
VSVAVALSDELYIHEVDAAMLLADARPQMQRRPDRDIVAAAKDLYYSRRRELVLFLQELLRVHLLNGHDDAMDGAGDAGGGGEPPEDTAFREALLRERDGLIVEHDLLSNILDRIAAGLGSLQAATTANPRPAPSNRLDALHNDEAILLAESVFLITYSVQVTSRDALAVRDLLEKVVDLVAGIARDDEASTAATQRASANGWSAGHFSAPAHASSSALGTPFTLQNGLSRFKQNASTSYAHVRAESLQNILFLAWICCLDRTRYSDLYNPATGESGVNALLKDPVFVKRTCGLPAYGGPPGRPNSLGSDRAAPGGQHLYGDQTPAQRVDPSEAFQSSDDPVLALLPVRAAAELGGALFRLAVAEPDTEEALLSVLRVCAYGRALEYLSAQLPDWMEFRAGSLLPDSQLYADVFEDFTFDLSEAPDVPNLLFRWTQDELQTFALSKAGIQDPSSPNLMMTPGTSHHQATPTPETPAHDVRKSQLRSGKPPKPPSIRGASAATVRPGSGAASAQFATGDRHDKPSGSPSQPKNLVAVFGCMVARAIDLNPEKLLCGSGGGGSRYWVGVGAESVGLVPRVGDAVLDMWDAALGAGVAHGVHAESVRGYRSHVPNGTATSAEGCFEDAFVDALQAFLDILRATSVMNGSVTHAAASLRFLCESGHPVASVERASQALSHFYEVLSASRPAPSLEIGESETAALSGVLSIIANCAKSLEPHGGIGPIIGQAGAELGTRAASLALQEVPSRLRASIVHTLTWLGDRRAVVIFLDEAVKNKSAKLRQMIRGQEAQLGIYDATVRILELAKECCTWSGDEFPRYGIEGILAFAVDEVLAHWTQRKYATDSERWRLIFATGEALLATVRREHDEDEGNGLSNSIFSKLLCPAPGTGTACAALRALISSAGLRRTSDDGVSFEFGSTKIWENGIPGSTAHIYRVDGRDSLAHAFCSGDGEAFREMESAAAVAARVLSHTLSLPPSHVTFDTTVPARASELILCEPRALVAAGSLVFAIDDCTASPSPFRLGYSSSTCRAVLGMLALASSQSSHICKILILAEEPMAASRFRCSVADVIASYSIMNGLGLAEENLRAEDDFLHDPPRIVSALHLVEACLGMDGSSRPGLYLLGLSKCLGDQLYDSDYGVLSALVELVAGISHGSVQRIDEVSRSTAAVFLERLAGNTTPSTSRAVLEFIRRVTVTRSSIAGLELADEAVGFGCFSDEILSRILEVCSFDVVGLAPSSEYTSGIQKDVNWVSLGELAGACMRLSALLVRQYPDAEQDSLLHAGPDILVRPRIPSPDSLLRLVAGIAESGSILTAVDAFRKWHHLLAARLRVHPTGQGHAVVPLLLDIAMSLLDALESSDSANDLGILVSKDGGAGAAAAVLLCLGHIRDMERSYPSSSQAVLLSKVIRALERMTGTGPDVGQGRTSLYAAFLICGQMAETQVPNESIAQCFSGRVGARHTSGAEAFVACASGDACSMFPSATRAAAITSLACAARLDHLRIIPALSAQNRLRRIVANAIADPLVLSRIVEGCSQGSTDAGHASPEKATVVVAEAALSLIHAVSLVRDGTRLISDAACLDSVATLLSALSSSSYSMGAPGPVDGESSGESVEDRFILVADSVTCAVAAAVIGSESGLVEGALAALHAGERIYCRAIRALGRPRKVYLSTVSHVAMVLSRIPHHVLSAGAVPAHLRSLLACYVGSIAPYSSSRADLGESNSPFSAGLQHLRPGDARDAARMNVIHPEGGSLYERDVVAARVECLKCVLTALRPPVGLLLFFAPRLSTDRRRQGKQITTGALDELTGAQGELGDILRMAHAALDEMRRSADESVRLSSAFAGETSTSISAQDLTEIAEFCSEDMGITPELVTGEIGMKCMREAARSARELADSCGIALESSMYILREYIAAASSRSSRSSGEHRKLDADAFLTVKEANSLVEDAQTLLLPLCKEVDAMQNSVWGRMDPSFCRQLCRQIRTNVANGISNAQ